LSKKFSLTTQRLATIGVRAKFCIFRRKWFNRKISR